ncbi:glycosyltransferase family 2 protein [Xylogone sp. PMI_703]|nr:glycosyltransferase family 2 protein [Xylogone sp. PMI_703]
MLRMRDFIPTVLVGLLGMWIAGCAIRLMQKHFWSIITIISIIWFPVRYVRFVGNTIAHWRYKSIPIPTNPTYSSKDVTVIVATINVDLKEFGQTIRSMLACNPFQIFVVTRESEYQALYEFSKSINVNNLEIFEVPMANKRHQLCRAIPPIKTEIVVFADGDVTWPSTILPWLLAPFEDKQIGGVGTSQRVRRLKTGSFTMRCYNWLCAAYIERRNFEISATHWIDGGTSCMSGRTHALRALIVKNPPFQSGFLEERWGKRPLYADDDNFVTRWLTEYGWKTWIQYDPGCEIETTLENNFKFISQQCCRWARSNWRSNYTSLATGLWTRHLWCFYALYLTMFINFAVTDFLLFPLWSHLTSSFDTRAKILWGVIFFTWWLFTKNIKLVRLYRHNIWDIRFSLLSILFGFFHGFIKLYAAFTLDQV